MKKDQVVYKICLKSDGYEPSIFNLGLSEKSDSDLDCKYLRNTWRLMIHNNQNLQLYYSSKWDIDNCSVRYVLTEEKKIGKIQLAGHQ